MSHNARNREHRFVTVAQDAVDEDGVRVGGLLQMSDGQFYWWLGPSRYGKDSGVASDLVLAQQAVTQALARTERI